MATAISDWQGGREGAGEAKASGTGQWVSRHAGQAGYRNKCHLCHPPALGGPGFRSPFLGGERQQGSAGWH